jgi:putative spermidine/putrescine transport system permease protein
VRGGVKSLLRAVMYIVVTATLLTLANVFLGLAKVLNVEHPR